MKIALMFLAVFTLAACTTSSGIVPDGADGYRLMRSGDTGFTSSASLREDNFDEAAKFCADKGLTMETRGVDSKQAHILGGFPSATLLFRCVKRSPSAGDSGDG